MKGHLLQSPDLTAPRYLRSTVENRTCYSHNQFELNVFETHIKAEQIELQFRDFVFTAMFRGKKVMHLPHQEAFDYLPGESVLVAPTERMLIDFPEASPSQPTQCLAIELGSELLKNTVDRLNSDFGKDDACGKWAVDPGLQHLINDPALANTLNRMVQLSIEEQDRAKDLLLDLSVQELLVRLMQTQARTLLQRHFAHEQSHHPMAAAVAYFHKHLHESIQMEKVAAAACMSRAKFFRLFKVYYGQSPARFLADLRLERARNYLRKRNWSIAQIASHCGFENSAHFSTAFKRNMGLSPLQYRQRQQSALASTSG